MKYTIAGIAAAAVWYGVASSRSVHVNANGRGERSGSTQQDTWTWQGRLAEGKTLSIFGVNGDVSAEAATGDQVEVSADKHGRRSDPDDVRMVVVEHDGGVTICALYPNRRGREARCDADGMHNSNVNNNDVEVDFTIRVPRGVNFDGNTVNGDVEALNLSGAVEVATVNGGARLETNGGEASAQTVNGNINATVRALGQQPLRFKTVNGSVNLTLPTGLSASLDAETVNGSITSDFPVSVQGRMSPRHLLGNIGQGGRELELETVNGSIHVRKLP